MSILDSASEYHHTRDANLVEASDHLTSALKNMNACNPLYAVKVKTAITFIEEARRLIREETAESREAFKEMEA